MTPSAWRLRQGGAALLLWPSRRGWCMGLAMTEKPSLSRPPQRGGGVLIAGGLVLGAIAGIFAGQPSAGLAAGFGLGVVAAIAVAVADRR